MCFATLAVIGAVTSAVGTVATGFATAANANYQSQVASNNATIAQNNAKYAMEAGQVKAEPASLKAAQQGGAVKASQAANGVDVNSGSAVDVQTSERERGNLDTQTTLANADLQAYGYRTQATNYEAQSQLDNAQAEQAPIGAALSATGGLLSSASSTGFKWGGGSSGSFQQGPAFDPNNNGGIY